MLNQSSVTGRFWAPPRHLRMADMRRVTAEGRHGGISAFKTFGTPASFNNFKRLCFPKVMTETILRNRDQLYRNAQA